MRATCENQERDFTERDNLKNDGIGGKNYKGGGEAKKALGADVARIWTKGRCRKVEGITRQRVGTKKKPAA